MTLRIRCTIDCDSVTSVCSRKLTVNFGETTAEVRARGGTVGWNCRKIGQHWHDLCPNHAAEMPRKEQANK
jgi:hypothetical protein